MVALVYLIYIAVVLAKTIERTLGLTNTYKKIKNYSKQARSVYHIVFPVFTTLLGLVAPGDRGA